MSLMTLAIKTVSANGLCTFCDNILGTSTLPALQHNAPSPDSTSDAAEMLSATWHSKLAAYTSKTVGGCITHSTTPSFQHDRPHLSRAGSGGALCPSRAVASRPPHQHPPFACPLHVRGRGRAGKASAVLPHQTVFASVAAACCVSGLCERLPWPLAPGGGPPKPGRSSTGAAGLHTTTR